MGADIFALTNTSETAADLAERCGGKLELVQLLRAAEGTYNMNHSESQWINQWISESMNESINKSTNESTNQPTNQLIEPTNQSITHSVRI